MMCDVFVPTRLMAELIASTRGKVASPLDLLENYLHEDDASDDSEEDRSEVEMATFSCKKGVLRVLCVP